MAKMIGDVKEYEAKQKRTAAKKPARLMAQLAAPIMAALINARRDRSDADLANRAIDLAQLLHETAIARTMDRQAQRTRASSRSTSTGPAADASRSATELYAASSEPVQNDREVPLPSNTFHPSGG